MIHGYHLILPVYGFWLPNDPRGSWSEVIRKWELLRFGPATKSLERRSLQDLTPQEIAMRDAAREALKYAPVTLTDAQVAAVGRGFAQMVAKSNYTIWACSILPEHTHLVLARHNYKVEQISKSAPILFFLRLAYRFACCSSIASEPRALHAPSSTSR